MATFAEQASLTARKTTNIDRRLHAMANDVDDMLTNLNEGVQNVLAATVPLDTACATARGKFFLHNKNVVC